MTLSPTDLADLTDLVQHAADIAADIVKLTDTHAGLTVAEGYEIQDELIRRRIAAGDHIAGYKGGLTSKAKMQQMGVNVPAFGVLMNQTLVVDGGAVDFSTLIHPKVEPEIAFVTSRELSGLDCTIADVLAATDFVMPAMEVIDSRFRDFKFDLPSVIADNTSAARYVVGGAARKVDGLDLRLVGVVMERNGQLVGNASGAAILGHPAAAVAALVHHLAAQGKALPAGSLVGAGAATEAVMANKGDHFSTRIQHLGMVSLRFT
jgi:2-oxo-3-hexenedioate decarboxylase